MIKITTLILLIATLPSFAEPLNTKITIKPRFMTAIPTYDPGNEYQNKGKYGEITYATLRLSDERMTIDADLSTGFLEAQRGSIGKVTVKASYRITDAVTAYAEGNLTTQAENDYVYDIYNKVGVSFKIAEFKSSRHDINHLLQYLHNE